MMMPLDNEEMEGAFGTVPMREHSEEKELDIAGDNPEPEPISLLDRAKRLFGADPNAVDGDSTSECDTDNLPVSVSLSKKRKRTANLTTEAENENAISDKLTASNPNDEAEDAEMELPDQSLVVKLKVQKTPGPSPDPSKSLYVLGKKSKSSIMEPKSKKRAPLLPLRRRKTTPVPLPPVEDMDKSGDEPRASPLTPESGNEPSVAKSSGPKEVELPAKTPPMAENLGLPIPQQEIEEVGSGKSAGDGSADESDLEDGSAENAIPDDSGIADTTMTDYLAEPAVNTSSGVPLEEDFEESNPTMIATLESSKVISPAKAGHTFYREEEVPASEEEMNEDSNRYPRMNGIRYESPELGTLINSSSWFPSSPNYGGNIASVEQKYTPIDPALSKSPEKSPIDREDSPVFVPPELPRGWKKMSKDRRAKFMRRARSDWDKAHGKTRNRNSLTPVFVPPTKIITPTKKETKTTGARKKPYISGTAGKRPRTSSEAKKSPRDKMKSFSTVGKQEEQDKLDDTNIMGNNDLIGDTIDSRRHSNTRESTSAPTVTTETTQDNISVPTKPRSPASTKKAPVKTARHSTPTTSLMGRLEILEHGNTVLEKENRALWDRLQRLEQKIGFT